MVKNKKKNVLNENIEEPEENLENLHNVDTEEEMHELTETTVNESAEISSIELSPAPESLDEQSESDELPKEVNFDFQEEYFIGGSQHPDEETNIDMLESQKPEVDRIADAIEKMKSDDFLEEETEESLTLKATPAPEAEVKYKEFTQSEIPIEVPKMVQLHNEIKKKKKRSVGSLSRQELNWFYKTGILPE